MAVLNTIEDFLDNERFRLWLKNQDPGLTSYWEAWLDANPAQRHVFEAAVATFRALEGNALPLTDARIAENVEHITEILPIERSAERQPLSVTWWRSAMGRAALLIGILSVGSLFWLRHTNTVATSKDRLAKTEAAAPVKPITVRNESAQPLLLNLPDNSSVLLTQNSALEYIDDSARFNREIKLTGEAFFEVVKMPDRPFLVHTNTMTTKVLGTSFLVRSFENEARATVRVRTGKVQVIAKSVTSAQERPDISKSKSEVKSMLLLPDQQASVVIKTAELVRDKQIRKITTSIPELFNTRNFVFRFTPVPEVFALLEKAYGTRIHYDQTRFKNCTITADLTDEPFLEKLKLICASTEAHFDLSGADVNISGNGCP